MSEENNTNEAGQELRLNTLGEAHTRRRRVGRGNSSGSGKTCGRGQKGQKSRSGSGKRIGFEGGQMPLQRRLPKSGFRSRRKPADEVRLGDLNRMETDVVDMDALVKRGLVDAGASRVKIILRGKLEKALTVKGVPVSAGAAEAIKSAGGKVE